MRTTLLFVAALGALVLSDAAQADPWGRDRAGPPAWAPAWGYRTNRLNYGGTHRHSFAYPRSSWSYGGLRDWSPQSAARLQRFELRQNLQDRWLRHRWDQQESYNGYYGLPSSGGLAPRRW